VEFCNLTTTFFTPLTPGRLAFGLVLGQVDRNVEMVDQHKEGGRPLWSTAEFKAFL
jgi:hypothetical protein